MYLRTISIDKARLEPELTYPFRVPAIASLDTVSLSQPVTFLVGENGTGKSTLLESLAVATKSVTVGGESVLYDPELEPARRLARTLKLTWNQKPKNGFFLRAEDFINYVKHISSMRTELEADIREADEKYKGRAFAASLAKLPLQGSLSALRSRYGDGLETRSHGESFFAFFQERVVPGGLYLLDEPETPLSPMKQIAFLALLKEMCDKGCQFIIATHSPILMAFPDADILNFDNTPIQRSDFTELEHVRLTRDFLNHPAQFLKHLF